VSSIVLSGPQLHEIGVVPDQVETPLDQHASQRYLVPKRLDFLVLGELGQPGPILGLGEKILPQASGRRSVHAAARHTILRPILGEVHALAFTPGAFAAPGIGQVGHTLHGALLLTLHKTPESAFFSDFLARFCSDAALQNRPRSAI
jgi:hypothetical protein